MPSFLGYEEIRAARPMESILPSVLPQIRFNPFRAVRLARIRRQRASRVVLKPWQYRFVGMVEPSINRPINHQRVSSSTIRESR